MTELTIGSEFRRGNATELDIDNSPAVLSGDRSRRETVVAVRRGLHARLQRGRFFNSKLFSDPAWDMLLELYAAALAQRRLSVSRLSERSSTPMTTALRWIAALEREGLAKREPNPLDGRQVFITLSSKGIVAMDDYFSDVPLDAPIL